MPRSRRFFKEEFKKEIVYKLNNNLMSLNEVENLHKIDRMLLRRWIARYGSIGEMPLDPVGSTVTVLNSQINGLIEAILAKKLEQLLMSYTPRERQMTDTYKAQKAS